MYGQGGSWRVTGGHTLWTCGLLLNLYICKNKYILYIYIYIYIYMQLKIASPKVHTFFAPNLLPQFKSHRGRCHLGSHHPKRTRWSNSTLPPAMNSKTLTTNLGTSGTSHLASTKANHSSRSLWRSAVEGIVGGSLRTPMANTLRQKSFSRTHSEQSRPDIHPADSPTPRSRSEERMPPPNGLHGVLRRQRNNSEELTENPPRIRRTLDELFQLRQYWNSCTLTELADNLDPCIPYSLFFHLETWEIHRIVRDNRRLDLAALASVPAYVEHKLTKLHLTSDIHHYWENQLVIISTIQKFVDFQQHNAQVQDHRERPVHIEPRSDSPNPENTDQRPRQRTRRHLRRYPQLVWVRPTKPPGTGVGVARYQNRTPQSPQTSYANIVKSSKPNCRARKKKCTSTRKDQSRQD